MKSNLAHLRTTKILGVAIRKNPSDRLFAFADSSSVPDREDRPSVSGGAAPYPRASLPRFQRTNCSHILLLGFRDRGGCSHHGMPQGPFKIFHAMENEPMLELLWSQLLGVVCSCRPSSPPGRATARHAASTRRPERCACTPEWLPWAYSPFPGPLGKQTDIAHNDTVVDGQSKPRDEGPHMDPLSTLEALY